MKPSSSFVVRAALLAVTSFFALSLGAKADLYGSGVDLGQAGRTKEWAIFTLGLGIKDTDLLSSGASVVGDLGVGGSGRLTLGAMTNVNGTVFLHTGGVFRKSATASITGGTSTSVGGDSLLNQAALDAVSASNQAFALAPSAGFPTTIRSNTSMSLSLPGSGTVVLKLTDFFLTGANTTLTLEGTAATTYVINVTNRFVLNGARIVLTGGLTFNNVLFNVRGTGSVSLGRGATLEGIILAPQRTVALSRGSSVHGEIVANKVSITGASSVVRYISP